MDRDNRHSGIKNAGAPARGRRRFFMKRGCGDGLIKQPLRKFCGTVEGQQLVRDHIDLDFLHQRGMAAFIFEGPAKAAALRYLKGLIQCFRIQRPAASSHTCLFQNFF